MSALSNSGTPGSVNAADWIATFVAADPTNPRIDSVYLVCRDSTIDATGALDAKLQVVRARRRAARRSTTARVRAPPPPTRSCWRTCSSRPQR
jgi:hypothetical protein